MLCRAKAERGGTDVEWVNRRKINKLKKSGKGGRLLETPGALFTEDQGENSFQPKKACLNKRFFLTVVISIFSYYWANHPQNTW